VSTGAGLVGGGDERGGGEAAAVEGRGLTLTLLGRAECPVDAFLAMLCFLFCSKTTVVSSEVGKEGRAGVEVEEEEEEEVEEAVEVEGGGASGLSSSQYSSSLLDTRLRKNFPIPPFDMITIYS